MAISAQAEAYLETIYNMAMEGDHIIAARLADHFNVSRATVSGMLKRLVAGGYLTLGQGHTLHLTPEGTALTEGILRRHRLTERLLFDVLGMDWVSAHEQAHALEHWIAPAVEERISTLLHQPLTCPHGNPIPGNAPSGPNFLRAHHAFRLSQAVDGQTVSVILISEVVEDESALLRRLTDRGIRPGALLTVRENEPDAALIFEVDAVTRSVPHAVAEKIWVREA